MTNFQYALELLGTFFFAISGALAIQDEHNDLFGAGFMGFVTAIGGGTLRDIMLGSYPLVWVGDIHFLYAIFAGLVVNELTSYTKSMPRQRRQKSHRENK